MTDTNEFINGSVAGITRAIISQPFDTVKTKMQSGNYKSSFDCLKTTVKNNGLFFLYKGIAFPLIGNSFIVGTHFHIYNSLKEYSPYLSGGCAGFMASFISNPVELVRIKMQMSDKIGNGKYYKNSFDCFKKIIEHNGSLGVFKGQKITTVRDVVGYAGFFNVYQNYDKYKFYIDKYINGNTFIHKSIKGSLCGFALWGSMYPIDVVKTVIQSSLLEAKQKKYSVCIQEIYQQYGLRGFYRGFGLTMFRAIPVNIGIVCAIDFINS